MHWHNGRKEGSLVLFLYIAIEILEKWYEIWIKTLT